MARTRSNSSLGDDDENAPEEEFPHDSTNVPAFQSEPMQIVLQTITEMSSGLMGQIVKIKEECIALSDVHVPRLEEI